MIQYYSTSFHHQLVMSVLLMIVAAALALFSAPRMVAVEIPPPSPITRELLIPIPPQHLLFPLNLPLLIAFVVVKSGGLGGCYECPCAITCRNG